MASHSADARELAEIRRLASDPACVAWTETARYDAQGRGLSKQDITAEIVKWIDRAERVKRVTLRGQHAGMTAYELKPRINSILFYIKLTLCDLSQPDESLLIISAHPDH